MSHIYTSSNETATQTIVCGRNVRLERTLQMKAPGHALIVPWEDLLQLQLPPNVRHVLQDGTTLSLARHSACHVQQAPI